MPLARPYAFGVLDRRSFLAATSAAVLAAACSRVEETAVDLSDLQVVQRFPQVLVPGRIRMPVSLATRDGLVPTGDPAAPYALAGRLVESASGRIVAPALAATRHDDGLSVPYWPFFADVRAPGVYTLLLDGGDGTGASVQVSSRDSVGVPGENDQLSGFDTPTTADPRGVALICTRTPVPCPLHEVTLTEALAIGKPVALLVGTPAFCSTGTCAPGLDALLAVREKLGDAVTFLHAEVYTDDTATSVAPTVEALGLTYEPALFLTNESGVVRARLDAIFDAREIEETFRGLGLLS